MNPQGYRVAPQSVFCPVIKAPQIDGRIDEREWESATRLTGFVREDGSAALSRTTVWLGRDEAYLYVAARCEERNTAALQRTGSAYQRDLTSRDHMEVLVNPAHDHVGYCRFYVGPFEQTETGRGTYRLEYREGPGSRWVHHKEQPDYGMYFRYASSVEDGQAWSFEMAIPFESLAAEAPKPGTVWGINLARHTFWPVYQGEPTKVSWPCPSDCAGEGSFLSTIPGQYTVNPLAYADLVFDAGPVQLLEGDFGIPHFGINRSTVRFKAPGKSDLVVAASVRSRRPGRLIDAGGEFPLASSGPGVFESELAWTARHGDDANVLDLAVKERASGQVLWRGAYDFGWEDGSLPLTYLYRGETEGGVLNPHPADPDFLIRKAEYIAGRQHRLYRRNTMQGAPSDFTLESADGSVRFNLMDPACIKAMAAYVHDCYENDSDRLAGLMFFAGQQAVMRAHTAYDPGASARLETLSLLRFGSGYCGHQARVLSAILDAMEIGNTGTHHRSYRFGIGGHAVVFVEHRGDYAILDCKHVTLYYRLDNTDLATVKELRAEPEIGRRAYPYYMPALMTFKTEHIAAHVPSKLDGNGFLFPEGAPTR
jgi:hypothetical protein